MCTESEPRFSFSKDLPDDGDGDAQCRRDADLLHQNHHHSSSTDYVADHQFEFSVDSRNDQYSSSSADELFADGVILPFHLLHRDAVTFSSSAFVSAAHRRAQSVDQLNLLPPLPPQPQQGKSAAIAVAPPPDPAGDQSSKPTKSFWGFKRSTSLNNGDLKKSLIFSLPPLLSRSKSTGSVPIPKKPSHKNEIHHHRKPIPHNHSAKSSSSSSSSSNSAYSFPQKPPLKKKSSYGGGGGGGGGGFSSSSYGHNQYLNGAARISPVLNVPAISKGTANLFGLGSILIGKEKKSRK
ncbi:hypothetical protein LINGRAHAP2_LOCUS21960 [Linum grandiflorum]